MSTLLKVKKDALEGAIKKIAGVYGQMVKKDAAVVVMQAVSGKRGEEVFKGLTLMTSNGSSQVATSIFLEMDSEFEGSVSISVGAELISAVNALTAVSGEFFTIKDNGGAILLSLGTNDIIIQKKIEGVMPVEFDIKKKELIEAQMVLSASDFKYGVGSILFAALNDDNSACGGVGVIATNDNICFRALDSIRLAESIVKPTKTSLGENAVDFVVSPASLKLSCTSVSSKDVAIVKTKTHIVVQGGQDLWQFPLLNKQYAHKVFDGTKAIEYPGSIIFKRTDLMVALDIVSVTSDAMNDVCSMCYEDSKIVLYGKDKQSKAEVPATVTGEIPLQVGYKIKMLKSCLSTFKNENVSIYPSDTKPTKFNSEGEDIFVAMCGIKPQ